MASASPIRFAIFAAPRTGSNYLCGLLNSHPRILCHHGLFNPEGIHYALDHRDGGLSFGTLEERDRAPLEFLEKVWAYDGGNDAVGFKFNSGENPLAADAVIRDRGVHKVLLSRRNRLKTYLSERIAAESGQWESYGRMPIAAPHPVRVEPAELFRHIERNERYYAGLRSALRATSQTWFDVHYESLEPGAPDGDVAKLLAFLHVGPAPRLTAGSTKRNPDDLRALVTNFDELQSALAGTPLEDECHDAPRPVHGKERT